MTSTNFDQSDTNTFDDNNIMSDDSCQELVGKNDTYFNDLEVDLGIDDIHSIVAQLPERIRSRLEKSPATMHGRMEIIEGLWNVERANQRSRKARPYSEESVTSPIQQQNAVTQDFAPSNSSQGNSGQGQDNVGKDNVGQDNAGVDNAGQDNACIYCYDLDETTYTQCVA